tara:strand:- start:1362 stop:1559 length:198 start_codon:yes stop_codon:yes gene_type:complete
MNEEVKDALGEGYDMIVDLMKMVKDMNQALQSNPDNSNFESDTREILNKSRGVLDGINDELYKTL